MDEENELLETEHATYPLSSLLGDIGGATGLFLGLSLVGILEVLKQATNVVIASCLEHISKLGIANETISKFVKPTSYHRDVML